MNFTTIVSTRELAGVIGKPRLVILDCRFELLDPAAGRAAWMAAHIPGAVYADLDKDLAAVPTRACGRHPLPDPAWMAERFAGMGISNDSQVVVYDAENGGVASRAWWLLRWLGHEKVALLDGGFAAWRREQLSVSKGSEPVEPGSFTGRPRSDWILDTAELAADPEAASRLRLVDARSSDRFRGEFEPIDPVAGHIPGARNLPFTATLQDDGRLRTLPELRKLLNETLGGDLATPWSVMCGSGVTACQLALVAARLGLEPPRVYVGSFSEWVSDPLRPVAQNE